MAADCASDEINPDIVNDVKQSQSLPPLTDQHIFSVFIGSGISHGDVNHLGLLLGVPTDLMPPTTDQPGWRAFLLVKKWIEMKAPPPDKSYLELEKHLKTLELSRAIPRLYGKERYTIIQPSEILEFLSLQTKDFTVDQAYIFGLNFGFDRRKVDDIRQQHNLTSGASIILYIFESIDRKHTSIRAPLLDEIMKALVAATPQEPTPTPEPIQTPQEHTPTPPEPIPVPVPAPPTIIQRMKDWVMKNRRRIKYVMILVLKISLFLLGLLLAIAILLIIVLPKFPDLLMQPILPGDTILYTIPPNLIYWLHSINLLLGPGGSTCSGEALLIDCRNVISNNKSDIVNNSSPIKQDYQYYIKDSRVTFTINSTCDTNICQPLTVFLFTTERDATTHTETNFNRLACANPPQNIYCLEVRETTSTVINVTSYYFIRCRQDPTCSYLSIVEYNSTGYDYDRTAAIAIDSTRFEAAETATLKIKDKAFEPVIEQDTKSLCIMSRLTGSCTNDPSLYSLTFSPVKWYDMVFYPSLFLGAILIVLGVYIGARFYRRIRKRKLAISKSGEIS